MRHPLFGVASVAVALGAAAACAASDNDGEEARDDVDAGAQVLEEAGASTDTQPDGGALDSAVEPERCSDAGWCLTTLPDTELSLADIWPVGDHAFAISASASRGVKVLEWSAATDEWTYIDDHSQNVPRVNPGNIWAPSEDEVYFAMIEYAGLFGSGPLGTSVFHGQRPVPPAKEWSWTRQHFPCDYNDSAPQVWGTSADDVYVVACRKIRHLHKDAGDAGLDAGDGGIEEASPWGVEWVDDDPTSPLDLFGGAGTGPDDAWFVGARGGFPGSCVVVVRKTAAGYQRIADGVALAGLSCGEKPGQLTIKGAIRDAFHAPAKERFIGTLYMSSGADNDVVQFRSTSDGGYAVERSNPGGATEVNFTSVWGSSPDDLWFIGSRVGSGTVVRGKDVFAAGGQYTYSTLALNGAPNVARLKKIRGTSNSNVWAVGEERAFHKTTP